ncbi:hypothetical protein [Piscinibacter koreensis]|uniref:non-specific serine/threonine protein kinase n=1 Tax=Piscinibacter koreensis TaxID=2742824 RepID=A0A7Y6NJN3_9BURK|nr:hypothetical protein [Schlegelella koreensis]NUZ04377.1 hypothetical protein [Schlegelella koreensis]
MPRPDSAVPAPAADTLGGGSGVGAPVRPAAAAAGDLALPAGTRLRGHTVRGVAARHASSIVYRVDDDAGRAFRIAEYAPAGLARRLDDGLTLVPEPDERQAAYDAGLHTYIGEMRALSRIVHPALERIIGVWDEHGSAYALLPASAVPSLGDVLAEAGEVPSEAALLGWLRPLLDGLAVLHEAGRFHHAIEPQSVRIGPAGPVLGGFAAATRALESALGQPLDATGTRWAAPEQVGTGGREAVGAAADLYAVAALVYLAIAGTPPPPAAERLQRDTLLPLAAVAAGLYAEPFLRAVDAALALDPHARPQRAVDWLEAIRGLHAPEAAAPADLMLEPFDPARAALAAAVERRAGASHGATRSAPAGAPTPAKPTRPAELDPVEAAPPESVTPPEAPPPRAKVAAIAIGAALIVVGSVVLVRPPALATGEPPPNAARAQSIGATTPALAAPQAGPSASMVAVGRPAPAASSAAAVSALPGSAGVAPPATSTDPANAPTAAPVLLPGAPATTPAADPQGGNGTPSTARAIADPSARLGAEPARPATAPAVDLRTAGTPTGPAANPAAAAPSPLTPAPTDATPPVANAAAPDPGAAPTLGASGRQARCVEILQKASLAPLGAADAEFYRRTCK